MTDRMTVSREEWLVAREALLAEEKALTKARDALAARRRELPRVLIEEDYQFDGPDGPVTFSELFGASSQLIIYHFMYGPDYQEGCPSCSFWADNFNCITPHLAARDAAFAVVSRAHYRQFEPYKRRMGWDFTWVSSAGNSFNADYNVSFTDEQIENGSAVYNYRKSTFPGKEAPGVSVFERDEEERIYHTYSTYSRGLDMLNGAYHYIDLLPKGRNEQDLPHPMAWVRRHDQY